MAYHVCFVLYWLYVMTLHVVGHVYLFPSFLVNAPTFHELLRYIPVVGILQCTTFEIKGKLMFFVIDITFMVLA